MFLTILMFISFQMHGTLYENAFKKSAEATYEGSEAKRLVDGATDLMRREQPLLTGAVPVAYSIGIKREIKFTSRKVSPIPDTVTTYQYNNNTHSGVVAVTWSL